MFLLLVAVFALVSPAFTRPQEPQQPLTAAAPAAGPSGSGSTPIPIINQTDEVNPDGTFQFSYETANGIKVQEKGYLKENPANATDKIQVIEGSLSYTANDGQIINLKYIADENGFQPVGDHLPIAPPVPEGLARQLAAAQPQQQPAGNVAQPQ